MRIVLPSVERLSFTPRPLQLIELAGRTCYRSKSDLTEETAIKFVRMIMKRGHESVLEHASATYRIVCGRGVSHELVRHRIASYSQMSTRYCDLNGEDIEFIEPFPMKPVNRCLWINACEDAERHYKELRDSGETPQIARSVLPICVKTEIVVTTNFREWRHIFSLRCARAAHPAIRYLMTEIYKEFKRDWPVIVEDLSFE